MTFNWGNTSTKDNRNVGWGSSNIENSGGWCRSGPKDKGCGGWGTFKGRPTTSRGSSHLGSSSCRRYPAVNYGRFPSRPRKVFRNTDRGLSLGKRSRQAEGSGLTTTTTFQRSVCLSFLYGPSTNHTCSVGSWSRGLLKSELISLRPSSVKVNTLVRYISLLVLTIYNIFPPPANYILD